MYTIRIILFLLAYAAGMNLSSAETIKRDVRSGLTTHVYSFMVYDRIRCRSILPPKVGTVKADNGKITTRRGSFKVKDGVCKGSIYKTLDVFYKSKTGFRGKDKASVVLLFPIYVDDTEVRAKRLKLNLNVK